MSGHTKPLDHESDNETPPGDDDSEFTRELMTAKLESITSGYNRLLNSQLMEQYTYFENRIDQVDTELSSRLTQLQQQLQSLQQEYNTLRPETEDLEREKKSLDKSNQQLQNRVKKAQEENQFLRDLNQSLLRDQRESQRKMEEVAQKHAARLAKALQEKDRMIAELGKRVQEVMSRLANESTSPSKPSSKRMDQSPSKKSE
eukprot:TRINITY_DN10602_c0_g1_i3.p1 TRINITY_DN10602_c0_g1~~TRINITY_DN10602_c0_g1_i3.p1  ORF type:complete len:215 (-),score=50.72 TRINITY_DN10602_c0_g1_i3:13-618(-)